MNRVVLGAIVLVLLVGAFLYVWQRSVRSSLQGLLRRPSPTPIVGLNASPLPSPFSSTIPRPSTTSNPVLPPGQTLPATGI